MLKKMKCVFHKSECCINLVKERVDAKTFLCANYNMA